MDLGSDNREYYTHRNPPRSVKQTKHKLTLEDHEVVSDVFQKNLNKLKKQFFKLSDKAIEANVMGEVLDNKNEMMSKIIISINKMSKKVMNKLKDYINLKFKVALAKNKIDIKQESFVNENDIQEIYEKLKFKPKKKNKNSKLSGQHENS